MSITDLMQKALSGAWLRHELLADNIANSETPGYKGRRLDFQSYLQEAARPHLMLTRTETSHIQKQGAGSFMVTLDRSSVTPDGNSVDVDKEMAEVSANALYYAAVSRQLTAQFSLLRKAITEGRR